MDHQAIIQLTADFIRQEFETDSSGHDWWHVYRVWKNALTIAQQEGANLFEVELAALLHDLDDWKFRETPTDDPCPRARAWLVSHGVGETAVEHICQVINEVSFKGAGVDTRPTTLEGQIVQDADRLDAIGAIGIGRAFAYGGSRGRPLHDPETPPVYHASFEDYKTNKGATINHFYEKLLLLHERLNTQAAQQIGKQRHAFMVAFLERFLQEWEGQDAVIS